MSGWYGDDKNSAIARASLIEKMTSNGAVTAKAVGDSFLDVAKIIDDRDKINLDKNKNELETKKINYELDKAYEQDTQNKINKKYLQYVNPETGTFDEDAFKKDNPDGNINNVDIDTRKSVFDLKNAYSERYKKEQDEKTSKVLGGALLKSNNEQEFYSKLTPDELGNISDDAAIKIKNYYDKQSNEAMNLKLAKQDLSNNRQMFKLEQELIEEKKKKNAHKDVKAADDSLIGKNIGTYFGGIFDPTTGEIKGLDKEASKKVIKLQAKASEIYKTNPDLTHNEASLLAIKEYENENIPSPTPKPDDKSSKDPLGLFNK